MNNLLLTNRYLVLLICFFSVIHMQSQTELEVRFEESSKSLSKIKDDDISRKGSFVIKVLNVNTGYIDVFFNVENKKIVSTPPTALASILPNISEGLNLINPNFSKNIGGNDSLETLKSLMDSIEFRANRLNNFRLGSKKLYKSIKSGGTDCKKKIDSILESYGITEKNISNINIAEDFKRRILTDIHYLENAKIFFSVYLTKVSDIQSLNNHRLLHFSSRIESFFNTYKKEEFLKYWKLLVKSSDIKTEVTSKTVYRASEDILEAEIILINSFTNDTIVKEKIDFFTNGRLWKLNFSSGFVYNNITENKYYLKERDEISNNLLKENTDDFDVSIGALAHLNYKVSSFTGVGFALGLGISPFDGQTRYFLGSGVVLGRKNQVGINLGAALSRIDALSTAVNEDELGLYILKDTEIQTFKKLKWGYFISLTYNLTNKKK